MDIVRYILGFVFKLAIVLLFVVLIWWFVATFFPTFSVRNLFYSYKSEEGWLPAPGSVGGLLGKAKVPSETDNVYDGGTAYNNGGSQVQFITYTSTGAEVITGAGSKTKEEEKIVSGYSKKELYIRNLSIYEGGHVYTGLSFIGEAKNTMFQNGRFPIIIADMNGRVLGTNYAEAMTNWSIPGWTRFQVKINSVLPNKIPCTMIFEEGKTLSQYTYSNVNRQPVRVAIPILCN